MGMFGAAVGMIGAAAMLMDPHRSYRRTLPNLGWADVPVYTLAGGLMGYIVSETADAAYSSF